MASMLERSLAFVSVWGVWVLAGLGLAAILLLARLGRGRRFLIPARWPARLASLAALGALAFSAFGLFCVLGPLRPMLGQVRAIESVVGRPAGDLDFRLVDDESPRRLSDLRGKVVVLNLWATWCGPCRQELPGINRLQRTYADRGLVVVTLSNEERALLQRFAARYPFTTLNVHATNLAWLDVPGRPLSMVIDKGGVVRECLIGARSYDELSAKVEKYLRRRA